MGNRSFKNTRRQNSLSIADSEDKIFLPVLGRILADIQIANGYDCLLIFQGCTIHHVDAFRIGNSFS